MALARSLKSVAAGIALTFVMASAAAALEKKSYDAASFKAAQAAGQSILVDVYAPWCPTCQAQHKVLDGLKSNPDYANVTIFEVDFDTQGDALKAFKASQQSTLIAFKGTKETGRSVGATKASAIEALLKSAVQ